jgi:hypothetical protein
MGGSRYFDGSLPRKHPTKQSTPIPVRCVKVCEYCHGPVDRHEHCFQCRKCKSIGDLTTGIMEPPLTKEPPKDKTLWDHLAAEEGSAT